MVIVVIVVMILVVCHGGNPGPSYAAGQIARYGTLILAMRGPVVQFAQKIAGTIDHVRVDIFYADAKPRMRAAIDLLGAFYLRGVAPPGVTTRHIYLGIIPYVLIQLAMLVALWFLPALATFLPHRLYGS